jgi:hypothetical protein
MDAEGEAMSDELKITGQVEVRDCHFYGAKPVESPMLRLFAAVKAVLENLEGHEDSAWVSVEYKVIDELRAAYRALNLEDEEGR